MLAYAANTRPLGRSESPKALIVVVAVKLLGLLVNGIVLAAVVGLISGACAVLLLRRRAGSSK